jgi:hypothetical protein
MQQTRLLDKVEEAAASPDLVLAQALLKGGRRLLRSKIELCAIQSGTCSLYREFLGSVTNDVAVVSAEAEARVYIVYAVLECLLAGGGGSCLPLKL